MIGAVKSWFWGVIAGALLLFGALAYRNGRNDEKQGARIDDYENAEDIRRRVSVDRGERLHEYDKSGYRD